MFRDGRTSLSSSLLDGSGRDEKGGEGRRKLGFFPAAAFWVMREGNEAQVKNQPRREHSRHFVVGGQGEKNKTEKKHGDYDEISQVKWSVPPDGGGG